MKHRHDGNLTWRSRTGPRFGLGCVRDNVAPVEHLLSSYVN
jgi:hypothetical protein